MSAPTIYLDQCVSHALVAYLRQRGFLARTAQAAGMSAAADDDQIRHAHANNWPLLTVNEKDFITWHRTFLRNGWEHSGLVTMPQTAVIARLLIRSVMMLDWIVAEFLDQHNFLCRWTDLQQRLNSDYMLEEYTDVEIALAVGRSTRLP
jgi:hypothetical protein